MKQTFSCLIIGESTLPIQCAEILLERGHILLGILSPDPSGLLWAGPHHIAALNPLHAPPEQLLSFLHRQPFDYLFSIVNYTLLPQVMPDLPGWVTTPQASAVDPTLYEKLITAPRKAAINYHDGPLPRYAGFYVTSWALLNGESEHGVTWHRMTDQVDAGQVFKQKRIPVLPNDTALTLNTRCYEAAIASFTELVDELSHDEIRLTQQDMENRSYFDLLQRPAAGGILDWNKPARELDALVRALDFGQEAQAQPNPLALPKIALGNQFFTITHLEIKTDSVAAPPGTILAHSDRQLTIAAADYPVSLSGLRSLDGKLEEIPALVNRFGLQTQARLPSLSSIQLKRLDDHIALWARSEAWWVWRLENSQPLVLPSSLAKKQTSHQFKAHQPAVLSLTPHIQRDVTNFLSTHPQITAVEFLSTAFLVYLARLVGSYSFDIGYSDPVLYEHTAGLENYFASCPPLNFDLYPDATFFQAMAVLQSQLQKIKEHGTYAQEILSRYPRLIEKPDLQGQLPWSAAILHTSGKANLNKINAALVLSIVTSDQNPAYAWLYNPHIFTKEQIENMLDQFQTLLHHLAICDCTPLWELPLLSSREKQRILVEWNDTRANHPQDIVLHRLFEAQVERTPDAIAVFDAHNSLSYRQLDRQANALAHCLIELGIRPDNLVGVFLDRSVGMVVAFLGVLKAGGAYVPLDPTYPVERLVYILTNSHARVLITQPELPALPEVNIQSLYLGRDGSLNKVSSGHNLGQFDAAPEVNVRPENLAYVLFTSGSTGLPKGVMIHHAAICNHMLWMQRVFPLDHHDAVLQKTPYSFDASVWEFYAPLLAGSRLFMVRPGGHIEPAYLVETIQQQRITTLQLVPTLLHMLLLEPEFANCTSLERVFVGGEALSADLIYRFQATLPARLINLYGPTEVTIDSVYWQFSQSAGQYTGRQDIPIGSPVDNVCAYILDARMQPLPAEIPGELYLGGRGLGRGYLDRPDLTAERFLPNPFSSSGERLYRTGDLVYRQLDGKIIYLGRLDHQIKLRGFRIELGEIETQLKQIKAVKDVVVLAHEDSPAGLRLVAYLVPEKETGKFDENQLIKDIRLQLADKLPEYMLPSAFVVLQALPLTPNSKVDRKALPEPAQIRREQTGGFLAPRSPTEKILGQIWQQVLGLDNVGVWDNFFASGGNSLLATQVVSRIQKTFEVKISLGKIFELPTIEEMALLVEDMLLEEIEALDEEQIQRLERGKND